MIIASVRIIPLTGKRVEILEILRHVQALLRASVGCLSSYIYEECDDDQAILYLEEWRSTDELHRHIESREYLEIMAAMELASEAPQIRFDEVACSQSMELIEALRATA